MKRTLLPFLVCPQCQGEMELEVFTEKEEIEEGFFHCSCGGYYPIVRAVPRLLSGELQKSHPEFEAKFGKALPARANISDGQTSAEIEDVLQVQSNYGAHWSRKDVGLEKPEMWAKHWDWFLKKMGYDQWDEFDDYFRSVNTVLDAGAGRGHKVKKLCLVNPDATILGAELSDSVEEAHKEVREFPNAHIVQADIRNLPFRDGSMDCVICDSVLHYTPSPRDSFLTLAKQVRSDGEIAIHVYKHLNRVREFTDQAIRAYVSKLSIDEAWEFCKLFTQLGRELHESGGKMTATEDSPLLGLKKGDHNLQRFIHYNIMLCFWDEALTFEENNWINCDYFHPAIVHCHRTDEVLSWFEEADFTDIRTFDVSQFGVTVRARRP